MSISTEPHAISRVSQKAAMTDGLDRLPTDLPGGWEFTAPFQTVPLDVGQVWRKCGPVGAIRIIRVMQPGRPEYDGGLPGISVVQTQIGDRSTRVHWSRQSVFWPGSEKQLLHALERDGFALAASHRA